MMWWPGGGWGWGGGIVMVFIMLAFLGLLVWTIATLVRQASGPHRTGPTPEEVLAERFARGEIDEDEYQERRDVLRRNRS